ncbi:hypothetical protein JHK87_044469 [Glycine soja]|nr:hypothetical protein JHK87_044469 [Glycine soja]
MPICLPNEPDAIIWKHNKDGEYPESGSLNSIRDLNLFQKMKIFLWRISRESLPARQRLSTKGVQCPITCASCGNCPETYHHAFVGCCNVEPVWEKASLWHIINLVRDKVSTQQPQPASTRKLQWGTPAPEYIKCNVDVAIFQDSRSFGVDCCFKDSTSHFIRAKTSWYQGIPTTHEAEVSSLLAAISSTSEIHLQNIIFEIDCRANVDVLSSKNFTNSEVGIILSQHFPSSSSTKAPPAHAPMSTPLPMVAFHLPAKSKPYATSSDLRFSHRLGSDNISSIYLAKLNNDSFTIMFAAKVMVSPMAPKDVRHQFDGLVVDACHLFDDTG